MEIDRLIILFMDYVDVFDVESLFFFNSQLHSVFDQDFSLDGSMYDGDVKKKQNHLMLLF